MIYRPHVLVCGGTGCTPSGSLKIMEALKYEVKCQGLEGEVAVVGAGCHGLCALSPIMTVYPDATSYSMVQVNDILEIASEHLLKGRVVTRLLYQEIVSPTDGIKALIGTDFCKKQHHIALRNYDVINSGNTEEYIGADGCQALGKMLAEMTPDDMIQTLLDVGLRGHGDTGFPTDLKWEFCEQNDADQKYVCCNVDEGDPDAFMNRSALEGGPHAILGVTAIAGYAIGSNQGYIYVRIEYPIAVERLRITVKQAREMRLLGKSIFGAGFDFDIDLRLGADALVCGEETALIASIEGKHGGPRPRPPFPTQKDLFEKSSILSNVEAYANVSQITLNGPEWPASMGAEKPKGTKTFALDGKINNTDLVEIPINTTLRTVVEEIGGDISNGKKLKAAQTGGPSGGCIPTERFDILINCDNLLLIDSMMGSDGLIVMGEDDCIVDIVRFFLEFTVGESCGKRIACHIGTKHMVRILAEITKGQAVVENLDKLEELCHHVKTSPLCGLGQTAPSPVLPTLYLSRSEYEAHIKEKHCPAGVCKVLLSFDIDRDKCRGCILCTHNYPVRATVGSIKNLHIVDRSKCIKCGVCMEKCRFGTIYKK